MVKSLCCDYDLLADNYDNARNLSEFYVKHWTEKIIEHGRLESGDCVLDIGCGTGYYTESLKKYGNFRVIGIDLSMKMLSQATAKLEDKADGFIRASTEKLPFIVESFELGFMFFVLHHIPEKSRMDVYHEILNILKPGGRFMIITRSHSQIAGSLIGLFPGVIQIDCARMPEIRGLESDLRKTGFSEVSSREVANFTQYRDRRDFMKKVEGKFISTLTMFDNDEFEKRLVVFKDRLFARFGDAERVFDPLEFTFVTACK